MAIKQKNISSYAFMDKTHEFLERMILQGKISLKDIPQPVRCDSLVYVAAMRVSRVNQDTFLECAQLMMLDFTFLSETTYNGRYPTNKELRCALLRILDTSIHMGIDFKETDFLKAFLEKDYNPFLQKAEAAGFDVSKYL